MKPSLKILKRLANAPPWEWPDDTGDTLLAALRDTASSAEELLLAVGMAGNPVVANDDLIHALLAVLRNAGASEDLRARAAIALGPVLEMADTDGFEDLADYDTPPISEPVFHEIQKELRTLYLDASVPKLVRRRVLEASVRAPQEWHRDAIRAAYAGDDEEWKLTAVFGMRYASGFDEQILASLESKNLDIHIEAVGAAGAWSIGAAWQHVVDLVHAEGTDRALLLEAIAAVGEIRPSEALEALDHLADSDDPEIEEAVADATSLLGALDEDAELDEEDEEGEGPGSLH
jgi:hypothetical protein